MGLAAVSSRYRDTSKTCADLRAEGALGFHTAAGRGDVRGRSSVGRAPALQAGGQGFEPPRLHCKGFARSALCSYPAPSFGVARTFAQRFNSTYFAEDPPRASSGHCPVGRAVINRAGGPNPRR
jgi:hypothetical protein